MVEIDPVERVAGWLAVRLQHRASPLSGCPVTYTLDSGTIRVAWRGGPLAGDVAAALVTAADPEVAVTAVTGATAPSDVRADLVVGTVPVVLVAYDPDPTTRPEQVWHGGSQHRPRDPLTTTGAAYDSVLWHTDPSVADCGVVTVVRSAATVLHQPGWSQPGFLVVDAGHTVPRYASGTRHNRYHWFRRHTDILVRDAAAGWTAADAQAWADDHANRALGPMVAGVLLDEHFVLRIRSPIRPDETTGWRIHAGSTRSRGRERRGRSCRQQCSARCATCGSRHPR